MHKLPPFCADFKKCPDKTDKNSQAKDFSAFKLSPIVCEVFYQTAPEQK